MRNTAGGIRLLGWKAEVRLVTSLEEEEFAGQAHDADGIIVRANGVVGTRMTERAPRLKAVACHEVGVEHVDLGAAAERGIQVINTLTVNTAFLAEHCLAPMLMLSKRIGLGDRAARQGDRSARYTLIGQELQGKVSWRGLPRTDGHASG